MVKIAKKCTFSLGVNTRMHRQNSFLIKEKILQSLVNKSVVTVVRLELVIMQLLWLEVLNHLKEETDFST